MQDSVVDGEQNQNLCMFCAGYIGTSVNMGMKCLVLRCPVLKCNSAVDKDMIHMLASNADRDLYDNYLMRSYIECNFKVHDIFMFSTHFSRFVHLSMHAFCIIVDI